MIQRRIGLDAVGQQFVDQAVVEVEAFGIGRAGAIGKYPRPCDRKPVVPDAEIPDQPDVFLVAMVVVVGAVAGRLVLDLARRVRKSVPDRAAAAVFIDGALDLIGRGGGAPHKTFGKAGRGVRIGGRLRLFLAEFAGVAAIPSAERPASLPNCRRENFRTSSFFRGRRMEVNGPPHKVVQSGDCFKFCRLQAGSSTPKTPLGARDDLRRVDEAQRDQRARPAS